MLNPTCSNSEALRPAWKKARFAAALLQQQACAALDVGLSHSSATVSRLTRATSALFPLGTVSANLVFSSLYVSLTVIISPSAKVIRAVFCAPTSTVRMWLSAIIFLNSSLTLPTVILICVSSTSSLLMSESLIQFQSDVGNTLPHRKISGDSMSQNLHSVSYSK